MIVGEANPLVGGVHDRMPAMLMSDDYDRWLGPTTSIDDLKAMLKPYGPALMEAYAVNRAVEFASSHVACCKPGARSHTSRGQGGGPPFPFGYKRSDGISPCSAR